MSLCVKWQHYSGVEVFPTALSGSRAFQASGSAGGVM